MAKQFATGILFSRDVWLSLHSNAAALVRCPRLAVMGIVFLSPFRILAPVKTRRADWRIAVAVAGHFSTVNHCFWLGRTLFSSDGFDELTALE